MTVSIRISSTSFGTPYSLPEYAGTLSPGDQSSVINTYISHDGTVEITNCSFYLLPYSAGIYLGAISPQDDYDLIIGWGDNSYPAVSGGGLYINQNASGGFPSGDYEVIRTGFGDTLGTAIPLSVNSIVSGAAVAGEIASGGEAHLCWRLDPPAAYTGTGIGYVDTLMYYNATS